MHKIREILLAAAFAITAILPAHSQTKEFLMGREDITSNPEWTIHNDMYIQRETLAAFLKMQSAARECDIELTIVSAYRPFSRQTWIWDKKWSHRSRANMTPKERALDILKYSSMPGTSRHHWGTDLDLNSVSPRYFETKNGAKIYSWLVENGAKYGFYQPYTAGRKSGYKEEVWHWSYTPLSRGYLERYLEVVSYPDFGDFLGSEIAEEIEVIEGWVNIP